MIQKSWEKRPRLGRPSLTRPSACKTSRERQRKVKKKMWCRTIPVLEKA